MPDEVEVAVLTFFSGGYIFLVSIQASYVVSFSSKIPGMAPLSAAYIYYFSAGGQVQQVHEPVQELMRFSLIAVAIEELIIFSTEPISEPRHNATQI